MKTYYIVKERNILPTIKRRKAIWIGHVLRRNCLIKHIIEEKIEGRISIPGRRGRRSKQLLDDLRLGAHWQLKSCEDKKVAVKVRALQLKNCLYWQHFFSFSTEWTSQRQHVYMLFCLE